MILALNTISNTLSRLEVDGAARSLFCAIRAAIIVTAFTVFTVTEVSATQTIQRKQHLMGTWLTVTVEAQDQATAWTASEAAFAAIAETDRRLSTWRDDSELALVNQSNTIPGVKVSPELEKILREVFAWHRLTRGAFNPAMGRLVAAWDLRGAGRVPDDAALQTALATTKVSESDIEHGSLRFASPGTRFEEGGFGKGVALRSALSAATTKGAICTTLDFGGQIAIAGSCDGLTIAVAKPGDRDSGIATLEVVSGSVASSGLSERSFVVDGTRYGHILNPHTGRPAENWGAVTVIAADPVDADCASTALFVMGPDAGAAWAARQRDIEALFVERTEGSFRLRATSGLTTRLESSDGHTVEWISEVDARQHGPPALPSRLY